MQPAAVADSSLVLVNSTDSGGESSAVFENGLSCGRRTSLDGSRRVPTNTVVLLHVGRTGRVRSANRNHRKRSNRQRRPVGVWSLRGGNHW